MDVEDHNIKDMDVSPGAESMEESLHQARGLTKLPGGETPEGRQSHRSLPGKVGKEFQVEGFVCLTQPSCSREFQIDWYGLRGWR